MRLNLSRVTSHCQGFAATVDEYTGIDRADQYLLDHLVRRFNPSDAAIVCALLDQAGHLELMLVEVALDCAGTLEDGELLKQDV
jgi:hypothetical protein